MTIAGKPYRAPAWLPGGHAQTIWPLLIKPLPLKLRRERWETPDGDFIDVDFLDGPPDAPLLVLFHGLEGSSASHYALSTAHACKKAGWRLALPHFRGCSGELNRRPRAYHSGDSEEIDWILRRLHARQRRPSAARRRRLARRQRPAQMGRRARRTAATELVTGVAAICAPLDLAACGHHLAHGFNRIYTQHFLKTLKAVSAARLRQFPGLFDEARMLAGDQPLPVRRRRDSAGARFRRRRRLLAARLGQAVAEIDRHPGACGQPEK